MTNVYQTFIGTWINVCQMFVMRIRLTNVWRTQLCSCPPVDHRMSHPHAGNVPEVVHRMCRIRWTTGCAASGGPLDVCMRWTTGCVQAVVCTWWKSDGQPDVSISDWRLECYELLCTGAAPQGGQGGRPPPLKVSKKEKN